MVRLKRTWTDRGQRVEKDHTKLSEEALQELAKQAVEIIATEKEELTFIEAHCTQRHCLHW